MKRTESKRHLLKSNKTKLILLAVLVVLLGAIGWTLNKGISSKRIATENNPPAVSPSQNRKPNGASPNLSPPTTQDQQYNDAHKDALAQQQASSGSAQGNDSGKSAVITNANNDSVKALVSGAVEDGGTCTFIFTQGSSTVAKTSRGVANVSTTICALINPAPSSFLSKGNWNVALSYTSSTTSVKSSAYAFGVK